METSSNYRMEFWHLKVTSKDDKVFEELTLKAASPKTF